MADKLNRIHVHITLYRLNTQFLNIILYANKGKRRTDGYIKDIEITEKIKMKKVLERMLTLHLKINSVANRFASFMNFSYSLQHLSIICDVYTHLECPDRIIITVIVIITDEVRSGRYLSV